MVISSLIGTTSPIEANQIPSQIDSAVTQQQVENKKALKEADTMMSTEQYVREHFSDIPIMIAIAKCESRFRQLDRDGDVHRGAANNDDVGVMQINEFYHLDKAEEENYNIYTLQGNIAYARELYFKEGTGPWNSSKFCWSKYLNKDLAMNTK